MPNGTPDVLTLEEVRELREWLRVLPLLEDRFPQNEIVNIKEGHVHELMLALTTKGDLLGYAAAPVRIPVGTVEASLLEVLSSDDEGIAWVGPQACRVYNSAAETIGTGNWTTLTYDSERTDSNTMHSTSSNTGRITAQLAGFYGMGANINWESSTAGDVRGVRLRVNGSDVIAQVLVPPSTDVFTTTLNIHTFYELDVDDYVEVQAYQNTGGDLDVNATTKHSPEFWAYRLGGEGVTPVAHTNILTLNWIE